jgi:hypothetical protein
MLRTAIALSLLTPSLLTAAARAQTASEIIARSLEARGGLAALQARATVKMTGYVERPQDGFGYSMVLYRKRPAFYRSELTTGDTAVIRASDGQSAWFINTVVGILEPADMPADQAAVFMRQADMDTSLQGLLPAGSEAEYLDTVVEDGVTFLRVRITHQDGDEAVNYYDATSYLVRKTQRVEQAQTGAVDVIVLLSDYREVDGVLYSFKSERRVAGVTVSTTIWSSFEHDVEMPDGLFTTPE